MVNVPNKNYGATTDYNWLANASLLLAGAGGISMAIGAWAEAEAQKSVSRQEAAAMEYAASESDQNARRAEIEAQAIFRAGERESAIQGAQYGQVRGAAEADLAASGVQVGVGSSAEVLASIELAKQQDLSIINRNTVRAAYQRRAEATNLKNQARMQRVSAANIRGMGSSISTVGSALSSAVSSGSRVAGMAYSYYGRSV